MPCVVSFALQTLPDSLPDVHPPSTAFSEMHLPPTVPSVPALMPAWPNEPTTYGRTGLGENTFLIPSERGLEILHLAL